MVKLSTIVINTNDPAGLAEFWTAFLETEVSFSDSGFTWLRAEQGQPRLAFQEVTEPTTGRRRLHLDFTADDVDAETARALSLGATHVEEHAISDFSWVVLADPDGNEFCIAPDHG
ncbi:VOC family protein [Arthrobacter sp. HLT1-20]